MDSYPPTALNSLRLDHLAMFDDVAPADETLHMQQVLTAVIVHDIKTPLRCFMWTAKSLQEELEQGQYPEALSECAQLLAAKATFFHHIACAKGIDIINHVDTDLALYTDPDCLAVILHNVLDNALKFTAAGCIQVSCSQSGQTRRKPWRARRDGDGPRILCPINLI